MQRCDLPPPLRRSKRLQAAGQSFLIPLRLDACDIPDVEFNGLRLVAYHAVDLWEADGYARLCEVIDAGILPAHPTHPRQRHPDWDDVFEGCTCEVDEDVIVLASDEFELVIHALQGEPSGRQPPPAREDVYIKPFFPVPSLATARDTAAALGGQLRPSNEEWEARGFRACEATDPDGNVIQFRERALQKDTEPFA